jgi:hypothetical protein
LSLLSLFCFGHFDSSLALLLRLPVNCNQVIIAVHIAARKLALGLVGIQMQSIVVMDLIIVER